MLLRSQRTSIVHLAIVKKIGAKSVSIRNLSKSIGVLNKLKHTLPKTHFAHFIIAWSIHIYLTT